MTAAHEEMLGKEGKEGWWREREIDREGRREGWELLLVGGTNKQPGYRKGDAAAPSPSYLTLHPALE